VPQGSRRLFRVQRSVHDGRGQSEGLSPAREPSGVAENTRGRGMRQRTKILPDSNKHAELVNSDHWAEGPTVADATDEGTHESPCPQPACCLCMLSWHCPASALRATSRILQVPPTQRTPPVTGRQHRAAFMAGGSVPPCEAFHNPPPTALSYPLSQPLSVLFAGCAVAWPRWSRARSGCSG
jgi:hypothetical protein